MRLVVPLRGPQRHPALPDRRSLERPGAAAAAGAHRAQEGVEEVVIGLTYSRQRGAHARVLRRAGRRAGRLRRDGPPLPEGPGRPADAGRRARARAALPRGGRRPTGRAAQPLHDRARALRLHGGPPGRLPGAAHRRRAAGPRHVESGGRDDARNLEAEGFTHRLDLDALAAVVRALPRARRDKGLPLGSPRSSTPPTTTTSSQGGMVSTTRRMLEELRRPELFDAVLDEVGRVRAEMGYPIIVTPVSQLVATQAVRNVIDGERWATVSDETVRYFLGHYGEPAAPGRTQTSPTACSPTAHRGSAAPRAAAPRGRARALRRAHLRRGAAAPADDAGGAGGRVRARRQAPPPRRPARPGRDPS